MKQIQKEAIAHYDRMIKWAKSQPENDIPDSQFMRREIDDCWYGKRCSYCNEYFQKDYSSKFDCSLCPLNPVKSFADMCCNRLWVMMNSSGTWAKWIIYAKKIKAYIKKNG